MADDRDAKIARLEAELQEARTDAERRDQLLAEALEQQAALADVLRVIAASPTAIQPVLDALVASVAELTGATIVVLWRVEGDRRVAAAHHGPRGWDLGSRVQSLDVDTITTRAIRQGTSVYSEDTVTDERFPDQPRASPNGGTVTAPCWRCRSCAKAGPSPR